MLAEELNRGDPLTGSVVREDRLHALDLNPRCSDRQIRCAMPIQYY